MSYMHDLLCNAWSAYSMEKKIAHVYVFVMYLDDLYIVVFTVHVVSYVNSN